MRKATAQILSTRSAVRLMVYNALGQQIRLLADAVQAEGAHRLQWDGRDALGRTVSSGLYFLKLAAGSHVLVRKRVHAE